MGQRNFFPSSGVEYHSAFKYNTIEAAGHSMKILDFIQNILIDEFKKILQTQGQHYLSFSLICQGIEFLGACLDTEPFSAKGLSAARFRRAIYDLFPISYRQFNQGSGRPFDLYDHLHCGLLHAILPEFPIELIQRSEKETLNASHLEVKEIRGTHKLVLAVEDLFEDYENACQEIIARVRDGRLKGWKFMGEL
jgi:hypothetical protein